ncbi:hypothetical protein [Burkholderia ubonensis]|uniref:hypothetical protein n=1 Tax=Burkholderia ubonensis TaxID=101571 RepID=UPI000F58DC8B|nr:hypothetical protein [Burkholderia ubonensis]
MGQDADARNEQAAVGLRVDAGETALARSGQRCPPLFVPPAAGHETTRDGYRLLKRTLALRRSIAVTRRPPRRPDPLRASRREYSPYGRHRFTAIISSYKINMHFLAIFVVLAVVHARQIGNNP